MEDKLGELLNRRVSVTIEIICLIIVMGMLAGTLYIMEWMGI